MFHGFGAPCERYHVGKRALAASFVPDNRNEIMVQGQVNVEPHITERCSCLLLDSDGRGILRSISCDQLKLGGKVPDEDTLIEFCHGLA